MRQATVVAIVLGGLGLAAVPPAPVGAQTRVVVPIIVAPRSAPPRAAGASSVLVTTRTATPEPGVTTTRVTVRDASGAGRVLGGSPATGTLRTVPAGASSVLVTTRTATPEPGVTTTRVTVRDASGAVHLSGSPATVPSEAPIDMPIVILAP